MMAQVMTGMILDFPFAASEDAIAVNPCPNSTKCGHSDDNACVGNAPSAVGIGVPPATTLVKKQA